MRSAILLVALLAIVSSTQAQQEFRSRRRQLGKGGGENGGKGKGEKNGKGKGGKGERGKGGKGKGERMVTDAPSDVPSDAPSDVPSDAPSDVPSDAPSDVPSDAPSDMPSDMPTAIPQAMISTTNALATEAGAAVLRNGGTAVDAFVAAQAVLGVTEAEASGLGGDGVAVYYDATTGKVTTFDASAQAPAAVTSELFDFAGDDFIMEWQSGASVGVPGLPRLMETLHSKYGKLEWSSLFQDAVTLATTGYPLSDRMFQWLSLFVEANDGCDDRSLFFRDSTFFETFINDDCTIKSTGSILTNPMYAETLQLLAEKGADAFYTGEVAADIVDAVQNDPFVGGSMELSDLEEYKVIERSPVCGDFQGYKVCGMDAPSAGGITVNLMLGILDEFENGCDPLDPEAVHLFTQANRLAYADLIWIGDPEFVENPVSGLLNQTYVSERADLIDLDMDQPFREGCPLDFIKSRSEGEMPLNTTGTSQISIVDAFGNALSLASSVADPFGNGVMVRGFLLNSKLLDFDSDIDENGNPAANRVEGGKRPLGTASPTIVLQDGALRLVTGSPGGLRSVPYTVKSIWNILGYGLGPQTSIDLPNFMNLNDIDITEIEGNGVGGSCEYDVDGLQSSLEMLGHTVDVIPPGVPFSLDSGLAIVYVDECGDLVGGADPRRGNTFVAVP